MDIPIDVKKAAADALFDTTTPGSRLVSEPIIARVAAAILAERERCARIVENPHRSMLGIDEDAVDFLTSSLARSIRDGRIHAPNRDAN